MSQNETTVVETVLPNVRRETRPTSPHLSIYKPQISSALSILHRITGFALAVGTLLLVLWLWGVAYDENLYECVAGFIGSIAGRVLLIGWTFAFFFHFANGIRHLFWDAGMGFSLPAMHRSGVIVILFSVIFTAVTWYCLLNREVLP